MPEGPEVKRVTDNLQKFKNKTLFNINILNGRYKKHKPFEGFNKLTISLPLKIKQINCKGKFIYFIFENNMVLFNTLGMSGRWTSKNEKHNNIEFCFSNKIYFNDYRNFGTFKYQNMEQLNKKLNELGPDILEDFNKIELFKKRLERKRDDTLIGNALLDQKVASGCGNYLRAEVLYESKISPFRKIRNLKENEKEILWKNLTKIGWIFYNYEIGIKKGVLQKNDKLLKTYIIPEYNYYKYYTNFQVYFENYGPKKNQVIREKLGTRTIHWVPKIQK